MSKRCRRIGTLFIVGTLALDTFAQDSSRQVQAPALDETLQFIIQNQDSLPNGANGANHTLGVVAPCLLERRKTFDYNYHTGHIWSDKKEGMSNPHDYDVTCSYLEIVRVSLQGVESVEKRETVDPLIGDPYDREYNNKIVLRTSKPVLSYVWRLTEHHYSKASEDYCNRHPPDPDVGEDLKPNQMKTVAGSVSIYITDRTEVNPNRESIVTRVGDAFEHAINLCKAQNQDDLNKVQAEAPPLIPPTPF